MHKDKTIENLKRTVLANEGFISTKVVQENPGKPVRIISVRYLSDMPVLQVTDAHNFRLDN